MGTDGEQHGWKGKVKAAFKGSEAGESRHWSSKQMASLKSSRVTR